MTVDTLWGTIPQWGTFASVNVVLVGLLTVWIKGVPDRLRAKTNDYTAALEQWKILEERINNELIKCLGENKELTNRVTVLERRDLRMGVALSMVLRELERLDPDSDIVKRAMAVLLVIDTEDSAVRDVIDEEFR